MNPSSPARGVHGARARLDRAWAWLIERPARGLVVALVLGCALRLPFVDAPFGDDEGGYLYVAQHWSDGGHWLYGSQWVDRPPVLVLIFRLVALLGGTPEAARAVAILFSSVLVASAWYAGRRIGGAPGAVAAALVAAALGSNPAILGDQLNSDALGASLQMLSVALLLASLKIAARSAAASRSQRSAPILLATGAGVAGVLAFLTKQSALVALVVAALLLGFQLRRRWPLLLGYAVGVVLPLAATVAWAVSGPGLRMLVGATWTFRVAAAHVVATASSRAPEERAVTFLLAMLTSGMVIPLAVLGHDLAARRGAVRLRLTVVIAAACAGAVILASLNFYSYYWLSVVPLAAVGVAVVAAPGARRAWPRPGFVLVVAATVAVAVLNVAARLPVTDSMPAEAQFVATAAHPGDTMVVIWGRPNLLEDAGLRTPYPYSWSLPVRVEDPHLRLFARVLAGPRAPTWLLEMGHVDDWHLETPRVRWLLARRYHVAARVCRHRVWLRDGVTRAAGPARRAAAAAPCTG